MAERIDDQMAEYVGILAKLQLTEEEREQAKRDLSRMLDYVDQLNGLDTENVEPLIHLSGTDGVFREDVAENGDDRDNLLKNAPGVKDGMFRVPRTVE